MPHHLSPEVPDDLRGHLRQEVSFERALSHEALILVDIAATCSLLVLRCHVQYRRRCREHSDTVYDTKCRTRHEKQCRPDFEVVFETAFEKVCETQYDKRCYQPNYGGHDKCEEVPREHCHQERMPKFANSRNGTWKISQLCVVFEKAITVIFFKNFLLTF